MIYTRIEDKKGLTMEAAKAAFMEGLAKLGKRERVLLIPPDITRIHGLGGML
ncbi:MAG: D-mannonate epimerase, partial [Sphaerochaeta sp.]